MNTREFTTYGQLRHLVDESPRLVEVLQELRRPIYADESDERYYRRARQAEFKKRAQLRTNP